MVAKGGFVEDKLSPVITKSVERLGLKKGHGRFGSYLLDDHSGYFFTGKSAVLFMRKSSVSNSNLLN